jgi:hypothetical protein
MRGCGLIGLDLGQCAWGIASGWAGMIPWWGWALAVLILVGVVWKIAGWPGLIALAAGVGFIFGRRSVAERDDIWPHHDPKPAKAPKKRRKTIFDRWRR